MKEKTIVSTLILATSLASYYYARSVGKDTVPFTMIGGFVGAVFGELLATAIKVKDKENGN